MAKRKAKEKRDNNTGSVYLYRGRYSLQYFDPITGKRRIKSLSILVDGIRSPVTVRADAEFAAAEFMKEITKISEISHKEEVILQLAEQKKLIRSLTLKLDDIWGKFVASPARKDAGENTMKGYRIIWFKFAGFLKKQFPPLESMAGIDAVLCEKYFAGLWATGVSEQTYNNHLQVLTLIFRTLLGSDFPSENPLRTIRKKTRNIQKREALTVVQLQSVFALLAPCSPYRIMHKDEMRLLLKLMTFTGCRGEDAALMEWRNIHEFAEGRGSITYTPEKTRRKSPHPVSVPIHPELQAEIDLAAGRRQAGEPLLLPLVHTRYLRNPSGISKDVMKLLEAAGISTQSTAPSGVRRQTYERPLLDAAGNPVCDRRGKPKTEKVKKMVCRYSMHSFRHTFVSLAAEAGVPLEVVRAIVGHASEDMTRHYLHVSDARKDAAMEVLPCIALAAGIAARESSTRSAMLSELQELIGRMDDCALAKLLFSIKKQELSGIGD